MTSGKAGTDRERIAELIERSSFGTPEAKALRASVTDEQAARVVQRARELDAGNAGTDPLAEAIRKSLPICCEECREDPDGALWRDAGAAADAARAHFAALLADETNVEKVARAINAADNAAVAETNFEYLSATYADQARAAIAAIAGLLDEEADRG